MSPFVSNRLLAFAGVRVKSEVVMIATVRMVAAMTGVMWRVVVCAIDSDTIYLRFCFCGS